MLADLKIRLRALVRGRAVERELDEELRLHLESQTERYVEQGWSPREAARRARLDLGGVEQVREACRDARGVTTIETVFQDLRYALRLIHRHPVFATTAILTLGFATAGAATVLTLWHALFMRDLPVERPDTLVVVAATRNAGQDLGFVSYPDYVQFRDGARSLEGLAAHYSSAPLFVRLGDEAREVNGAVVSANFFPLLGLQPALGRFFRDDEDRVPDRNPVAVLGYEFWRNSFGASPDALGATLVVNGTTLTVIGVAPAHFPGLLPTPSEIYLPAMMLRTGYRFCRDALAETCTILSMIGRMAEDVTPAQVRAEMETLKPARWPQSGRDENTGVAVFPPRERRAWDDTQVRLISLLALAAALLMLVCCANLSGLFGARQASRMQEIAVRAAIGAGPGRLVRQLLTEALVLAVFGGLAGLLLSRIMVGALAAGFYSTDAQGYRLVFDFGLAPEIVLAMVGVSTATAVLFGLVPALRAVRQVEDQRLTQLASPARQDPRLGRWLVAVQAGVAVALVSLAALLAAGAARVIGGTSYDPSRVAIVRVRPRLVGYEPERAQRLHRALIERLRAVPGVVSASQVGVGGVLFGGQADVSLPGWVPEHAVRSGYHEVGPQYFASLGAPLRQGRDFGAGDTRDAPRVAIVNETLARRLWPGTPPLGRALLVGGRPYRVVGVAPDIGPTRRAEAPVPYVYVPFWQDPGQVDARYVIGVRRDPAAMLPELIRAVGAVDPGVPVTETMPLSLQIAAGVSSVRLSALVLAYAAFLGLVLTATGLYGVLAFSVSRRAREMGIRLALGADPPQLRRMILRQGVTVVAIGSIAGTGLAALGTRLLGHLLYGPAAADPAVYAGAVILVGGVGLLACWRPAARAAATEPVTALRNE